MNTASCYEDFQGGVKRQDEQKSGARALTALRTWVQRSRGRENLRELDERLLQDIGVRREDAMLEARKPFWKL